jgi:hypothetical protein
MLVQLRYLHGLPVELNVLALSGLPHLRSERSHCSLEDTWSCGGRLH